MQSSKDLAYTDFKKASTFKKKKKNAFYHFPKQTPYLKHYAQDENNKHLPTKRLSVWFTSYAIVSLPNKVDVTALKALWTCNPQLVSKHHNHATFGITPIASTHNNNNNNNKGT